MKAKQFYLILLGIMSLMMVWSCKEDDAEPYINFVDGQTNVSVDYDSGSIERQLNTNVEINKLSVSSSHYSWCMPELVNSDQGIKLIIKVDENASEKERQAEVTVKIYGVDAKLTMTVTQAPVSFAFKESQPDASVPYTASTIERTLDTKISFDKLYASCYQPWCNAELVNSDQGIKLIIKVDENASLTERHADVNVSILGSTAKVSMTVKQGAMSFAFVDGQSAATIKWDDSQIEKVFKTDAEFGKLSVKSDQEWCMAKLEQTSQGYKLIVNTERNIMLEDRKANVRFYYSDKSLGAFLAVTQERIRIIYDYWGNGKSYVEYDFPGIDFQLNKVARSESGEELEIEYTLTNTQYAYNLTSSFWTSEFEPSIQDNTGRTYKSFNSNGSIYYSIGGKTFGIFGGGTSCVMRPNAPIQGKIIVRNFTQNATSVWVTIYCEISDFNMRRTLEFVNVPIEQSRTTYNIVK